MLLAGTVPAKTKLQISNHISTAEFGILSNVSKKLYILAGANGSGKSTIAKTLLPSEDIVYINPDDIARELNPSDPVAVRILAGRTSMRMEMVRLT